MREIGLWAATQLTTFQFYNPGFLRAFGVGVVNGALWSIPVEIQFYMVLPLCACLFRRGLLVSAVLLLAAIFNVAFFHYETDSFLSKLIGVSVGPYLVMIFIGVAFARFELIRRVVRVCRR